MIAEAADLTPTRYAPRRTSNVSPQARDMSHSRTPWTARWYRCSRLAIAFSAVGCASRTAAQSIDSIIARVATEQGGLGPLHTVRSKRLTGHITFDSATSGTIVVEQRRPNMIREEITTGGQTLVRAFDGVSGWMSVPTGDGAGVHVLSGDDARNIAAEADFDGVFIDARVKGNRIELAGRDSASEQIVYKLKVTLRSGYVDYWFIDSATALPIKWEGTRIIDGTPVALESLFRDYFIVEGLRFARVIETGSPRTPARQQMVFDHVDINPPLDKARFSAPVDSTVTGAAH
jgi:hypothetical protein